MTLRQDLKEVNKQAREEIAEYGGEDYSLDWSIKAWRLFREHGDSIEQLIDMALTVKK